MSKAESIEEWTRRNLMQCERLSSLIQPSFCRKYRDRNSYCKGCTQYEAMDAAAEGRPVAEPLPIVANETGAREDVPQQKEESVARKRIIAKCRCCGKEGKIHGRGLIVQCYFQHKREGSLEKFGLLSESPAQKPTKREEGEKQGSERVKEVVKPLPATAETPAPPAEPAQPPAAHPYPALMALFPEERDKRILERLLILAHQERRTLEAQILVLLEDMLSDIGDVA